jgi:hypothetical protein
VSETARRCLAIVVAVVVAAFLLHVLRFIALTGEIRGACAGVVAYLVGDRVFYAAPRRRGRRRGK